VPDEPVVRAAQEADADSVFDLACRFATSFVPRPSEFHRHYLALIADPGACVLVVEQHGSVQGYLLGFEHLTFFANGTVAWVEEIMVRQGHRQGGLGRMLMGEFERRAAHRGSKLVALATRRAAGFYTSLGYEESATYFRRVLG
jgi:GNAT superfamily N-acetyltransferase